MLSTLKGLERAMLGLFIASGFAGLIYQAIWSHYLGLSLGHAAYAQTLVLAIFMGGMALGAWLVSRFGLDWRRLIFAYAVVELAIGFAGIAFHPLFLAYTDFSQLAVYPALDSEWTVRTWQWGSAALLIAPQSILLGMTFPLMSGGYLRIAPKADGEILGGLYFTNSIGAAAGALVATFVLLPWVGMPGTVAIAGGINIVVGLLAWGLSRRVDDRSPAAGSAATPAKAMTASDGGFYRMVLVAAAITGASSFVYEIGWVRLLNQALGTTVHSFELMLSAFILGLAFGGLWIRRRSARIVDAVSYAAYAQIFMGIAALVSIPVFSQSFRWVGAMVEFLPKTSDGYALFSLGSGAIALLVMFPAAFFAGMTLPLFTMALLRRGGGEASIGRVYAANTLGAIVGVVLAVHVLVPMLGLRVAVTLAALADIVLGIVLLRLYAVTPARRPFVLAIGSAIGVLVLSLAMGQLDPRALASGVFRHGRSQLDAEARIHFFRDGKTASVAVMTIGSTASIVTNGKPDASVQMDPSGVPSDDEITMAMLGTLPLAVHPNPQRIAVIGWGSGMTTHYLLGSAKPRIVESIEIEAAMYEGARLFGNRVSRAYEDPRSLVRIDDARTYFSTGHKRYDVIVSEPSNPWVSGVGSLFTRQFYRFLGAHLNEGGMVVQWIHSYELDDPLLMTMVAALVEEFPHVDAYASNTADLILIASASPLATPDHGQVAAGDLGLELSRLGLSSTADFSVRKTGDRQTLKALAALYGVEPHSDFHPVVSLRAPRARFMGSTAESLYALASSGLPVLEVTGGRAALVDGDVISPLVGDQGAVNYWTARFASEAMLAGTADRLEQRAPDAATHLALLRRLSLAPVPQEDLSDWLTAASVLAEYTVSFLTPSELQPLWAEPVWLVGDGQPEVVAAVMAAYSAAAARSADMRPQALRALSLLDDAAPAVTREHMLVIALLGAIRDGNAADAVAIERELGRTVRPGRYGMVRAYLQAWIDTRPGS